MPFISRVFSLFSPLSWWLHADYELRWWYADCFRHDDIAGWCRCLPPGFRWCCLIAMICAIAAALFAAFDTIDGLPHAAAPLSALLFADDATTPYAAMPPLIAAEPWRHDTLIRCHADICRLLLAFRHAYFITIRCRHWCWLRHQSCFAFRHCFRFSSFAAMLSFSLLPLPRWFITVIFCLPFMLLRFSLAAATMMFSPILITLTLPLWYCRYLPAAIICLMLILFFALFHVADAAIFAFFIISLFIIESLRCHIFHAFDIRLFLLI